MQAHRQLESLGFAKQLQQKCASRITFLNYLKSLAIITSVFERKLATSDASLLGPFKKLYREKLSALLNDIKLFQNRYNEDDRNTIGVALAIADKIIFPQEGDAAILVGYLYVLEGSTLGGEVLLSCLRENFPDRTPGLRYFGFHQSQARESWRSFQAEFDLIEDFNHRTDIKRAAIEAFDGFAQIFESLEKIDGGTLTAHITSINPEAGNHEMPADPEAIEAAIKAANLCFKEFSILEKKFGERGRRFTMSDSCWLVTLLGMKFEIAVAQVKWLQGVLEPRGIPKGMLIRHLQILDECLPTEYQKAHAPFRLSALAEALR